jgi:hypothetical protein
MSVPEKSVTNVECWYSPWQFRLGLYMLGHDEMEAV